MKISYQTRDCSRCDGSGRMVGFSHVHGGVCFKCNGTGQVMTAAGKAAFKKVKAVQDKHCTKAASQVVAGDKIKGSDGKFRTVVGVEVKMGKGNGTTRYGVEGSETFCEVWNFGQTTISTAKNSYGGPAHRAVTVAWTPETITIAAEAVKNMKGAVIA